MALLAVQIRFLRPERLRSDKLIERAERWKTTLGDTTDGFHRTVVAEMDDQVVGFANFGNERDGDNEYTGELYAIYVLKEFQGQGIGRGLFQATAQRLIELGFSSMLLWVLAENYPSRAFYERMGGIYLRDKTIEIGRLPLLERAYSWRDLSLVAMGKSPG